MKSETRYSTGEIAVKLKNLTNSLNNKMSAAQQGDVSADREILDLISSIDEYSKKLRYSFLHLLENEGRLNSSNIPVLDAIEKMDDEIRKYSKKGKKEEDYLRRLAAHFEALTEQKLKEAEKMKKHFLLAKKYGKLAEQHENIAQSMEKQ